MLYCDCVVVLLFLFNVEYENGVVDDIEGLFVEDCMRLNLCVLFLFYKLMLSMNKECLILLNVLFC